MTTIVKEINCFITITQFINPNYLWKNGVKEIKNTQNKLSLQYIFYPIPKYSYSNIPEGVNMQQKFLFWIFTTIYLSWFGLANMSHFSQIPLKASLVILC